MTNQLKDLSQRDLLDTMEAITAVLRDRLIESECKVTKYVAREIPSTVAEGETIEHEGKTLRKVDRDCKTGDWLRFDGKDVSDITNGKLYKVHADDGWFTDDAGDSRFVRSTANVNRLVREVFESVGE